MHALEPSRYHLSLSLNSSPCIANAWPDPSSPHTQVSLSPRLNYCCGRHTDCPSFASRPHKHTPPRKLSFHDAHGPAGRVLVRDHISLGIHLTIYGLVRPFFVRYPPHSLFRLSLFHLSFLSSNVVTPSPTLLPPSQLWIQFTNLPTIRTAISSTNVAARVCRRQDTHLFLSFPSHFPPLLTLRVGPFVPLPCPCV